MSKSHFAGLAARVWFVSVIAAAILLSVFAFHANAAPWGGDKTQTKEGKASGSGGGANESPSMASITVDEELAPDFSKEVTQKVQEKGGEYIFGREDEVEALRNQLLDSDYRAVAVIGQPKEGRTGTIEEFARLNPDFMIRRLNFKKLGALNEVQATQELKKLILDLEKENISKAGEKKIALYIENLASLEQGAVMQPVQALWEQILRKANLFFIVETDPATLRAEIGGDKSKFKVLDQVISKLEVKPPAYDAVLSYLLKNRPLLEKAGAPISTEALEEAARIAVKFRGNDAFKGKSVFANAYSLADAAIQMVVREQALGQSTFTKLQSTLKRLKMQRESLATDLKLETSAEKKAQIQQRITKIDEELAKREVDQQTVGVPVADQNVRLAQKERDLKALESLKAQTETKAANSQVERQSKAATLAELTTKISALTTEILNLKQDMLNPSPASGEPAKLATSDQVADIAAHRTGLSKNRIQANFVDGLQRLENIKEIVYDQDHAIDQISYSLKVSQTHLGEGPDLTPEQIELVKLGLENPSTKPIGAYWFGGPSGVGKTEVTEQIPEALGMAKKTFDMGEFQEKHTVSRMIGAPPGYVGMDTPGELTQFVRDNPYSEVVFDEIEKAHPDILDALLSVMDKGRLSDNFGTVDFRNTIVVFTSNMAQHIANWSPEETVTFLKEKAKMTDADIAAKTGGDIQKLRTEAYKFWVTDPDLCASEGRRPVKKEFVGRLTEMVMFNAISAETKMKIAQKTMRQFMRRMSDLYRVNVKYSSDLISQYLLSFNQAEGGRSLQKRFAELVRTPVAELVISKKVAAGDTLLVGLGPSGQFEYKVTSEEQIAAAEKKFETGGAGYLASIKEHLISGAKLSAEHRQALSATGELVRKFFDPKWLVSEHVFRTVGVR